MYKYSFLAVILLASATAVSAGPITLIDTVDFDAAGTSEIPVYDDDWYGWGDVNKLSSPKGLLTFDYVNWEHRYEFNPVAETILSGTLTLSLTDDDNDKWYNLELGFGYGEDGSWNIGEVDTGEYNYDIGVTALADGVFSVFLKSLGGDFYIDKSVLKIEYLASVPEPGTVALLGAGLLGIGVMRRRKQEG